MLHNIKHRFKTCFIFAVIMFIVCNSAIMLFTIEPLSSVIDVLPISEIIIPSIMQELIHNALNYAEIDLDAKLPITFGTTAMIYGMCKLASTIVGKYHS